MSAFTDAMAALTPTYWYKMNESSGNFADSGLGGASTPLNTLVTPYTYGTASLLPGDPTNTCVSQDKASDIANRVDNGITDHPSPSQTYTWMGWCRPLRLQLGGSPLIPQVQPIINKFTQYQLSGQDTRLFLAVSGQSPLYTPLDTFVPGNVYFVAATFSGPDQSQKLYINGALSAEQALSAGQTVPLSSQRLRIGGTTDFGSSGFRGEVQHAAIWVNTVLPTGDIQNLYALGVSDEAEVAGQAANVFPWSRQVLAANPARVWVEFSNDSQAVVYLALGDTATAGGGIRIPPDGHRRIEGYTGAISAIHESSLFGAKRLSISER